MRIAVMGSGGVGGYYGGLLARAGHEVAFITRGAHLKALQTHGLRVNSVHGDFTLPSVQATDDPAKVGPVDLVLVCVKTPDLETAAQALHPMINPRTTVVSLQNGVDAAERIRRSVGPDHVLGGVTWISSSIEAPGVIRQMSQFRRIVVGELDGQVTPRARAVVETLQESGATVELSTDIQKVIWTKFVFIAALSGVGSITRLEIGDYRDVPATRALLVDLMREVEAVARASHVKLDPDVVDGAMALIDRAAPNIKPSMQRDVEAGRPSELESMIGVIAQRGRELRVPTPKADVVYAALLPIERKAQRKLG